MTEVQVESRIAGLAEGESGHLISGIAIGEDDITYGLEQQRKVWTAPELRAAASTLVGTPFKPLHSEQEVGKVVDAGYEPGRGVIYEAELWDSKLAKGVDEGRLTVSIEAKHADGGEVETPRGKAMAATDIKFTGIAIVQNGAAPSATAEPGEAAALSPAQIHTALADVPTAELDVEGTTIDATPPVAVYNAAREALNAKEEYDLADCGTGVGEMRAEQIVAGDLSPEDFTGGENTAIPTYLDSHSEDVKGIDEPPTQWGEETWTDGCGPVQYALWGGTATGTGLDWARSVEGEIRAAMDDESASEAGLAMIEEVGIGDVVAWRTGNGTLAYGKARGTITSGSYDGVLDVERRVTAPAVLIKRYRPVQGGDWEPDERQLARNPESVAVIDGGFPAAPAQQMTMAAEAEHADGEGQPTVPATCRECDENERTFNTMRCPECHPEMTEDDHPPPNIEAWRDESAAEAQIPYEVTNITTEQVTGSDGLGFTDDQWDGDAAIAGMPNPSEDEDAPDVLDQAHMAVPADTDARDSKSSWKLPFRTGPDAAVNTRALVAIDSALSGGRGGVDGISEGTMADISDRVQSLLEAAPDDMFGAGDDAAASTPRPQFREGSTVSWDWSDGTAYGRVADWFWEDGTVERTIDGTTVTRDSDDEPVYVLDVWRGLADDADGEGEFSGQALKSESELEPWDDAPESAQMAGTIPGADDAPRAEDPGAATDGDATDTHSAVDADSDTGTARSQEAAMSDENNDNNDEDITELKARLSEKADRIAQLEEDVESLRKENDKLADQAEAVDEAEAAFAAALADHVPRDAEALQADLSLSQMREWISDIDEASVEEAAAAEPTVRSGSGGQEATLSEGERERKQEIESRLSDLEEKDGPLAEKETERLEAELADITGGAS